MDTISHQAEITRPIDALDLFNLQRPGGYDFAKFMNKLIEEHVQHLHINLTSVTTTLRTDIPDGGVDAAVHDAAADEMDLLDRKTVWQFKAREQIDGTTAEQLLAALINEIEAPKSRSGRKAQATKRARPRYVIERLNEGYRYVVCLCMSLTDEKRSKLEVGLNQYITTKLKTGPAKDVTGAESKIQYVRVLGVDFLATLANKYPDVASYIPVRRITIIVNGERKQITPEKQELLLNSYYEQMQFSFGTIPLLLQEPESRMPINAAYIQLRGASRLDAKTTRRNLDEKRHEIEKQWRERDRLDERSIQERWYEYDFHYRHGIDLQAEKLDLHHAVITYPRLVILGEPGSGKTTLLRYLNYSFSNRDRQPILGEGIKVWSRIPLYVRLADLPDYSPTAIVKAAIPKNLDNIREQLTEVLLDSFEHGGVLLLLDGLDEVASDKRTALAEFVEGINCPPFALGLGPQTYPLNQVAEGNRLIVTCRIAGYDSVPLSGDFAHYTVLGLQPEQQGDFLRHWFTAAVPTRGKGTGKYWIDDHGRVKFDEQAREWVEAQVIALSAKLSAPSLHRIAQVPLLLALIAHIWNPHHPEDLPNTRAGLYWTAVSLLLRWQGKDYVGEPNALDADSVYTQLGQLAYCLMLNRPRGVFSKPEAEDFTGNIWRKLWQEKGGLFVVRGIIKRPRPPSAPLVADDYWFGFPHLSFMEYFAGCYLVSGTKDEREERIRRHLDDERWREAILFGLGYLQDSGERGAAGDLFYKLCFDNSDEHHPYDALPYGNLPLILSVAEEGVSLPESQLQKVCEQAVSLYFNNRASQERLIVTFSQLQGGRIAKRLSIIFTAKLEDIDEDRRGMAAQALVVLNRGDEEIIAKLLGILEDIEEDIDVRSDVAYALAEAADGGEEHNKAMIMERLFAVMQEDVDWDVRISAAQALWSLGQNTKEVVAVPLAALQSKAPLMCGRAISSVVAMGRGHSEVTKYLISVVRSKYEEIEIRVSAAEALKDLGQATIQVKQFLTRIASDKDIDDVEHTSAVEILDDLNQATHDVAANQLDILRNEDEPLNEGSSIIATEALLYHEEQTREKTIEFLQMRIKDADVYVRLNAAESLVNLEFFSADVEAVMLNLLRDQSVSSSIRIRAADTLAKVKQANKNLATSLLNILSQSDLSSYEGERIAHALGHAAMANPDMATELLEAIQVFAQSNHEVYRIMDFLVRQIAQTRSDENKELSCNRLPPLPKDEA